MNAFTVFMAVIGGCSVWCSCAYALYRIIDCLHSIGSAENKATSKKRRRNRSWRYRTYTTYDPDGESYPPGIEDLEQRERYDAVSFALDDPIVPEVAPKKPKLRLVK